MSAEQLTEYLKSSNDPSNPVILDAKVALPETDGTSAYWVLVANQSEIRTNGFKRKYPFMSGNFNNMVTVQRNGDSVQAVVYYQD